MFRKRKACYNPYFTILSGIYIYLEPVWELEYSIIHFSYQQVPLPSTDQPFLTTLVCYEVLIAGYMGEFDGSLIVEFRVFFIQRGNGSQTRVFVTQIQQPHSLLAKLSGKKVKLTCDLFCLLK